MITTKRPPHVSMCALTWASLFSSFRSLLLVQTYSRAIRYTGSTRPRSTQAEHPLSLFFHPFSCIVFGLKSVTHLYTIVLASRRKRARGGRERTTHKQISPLSTPVQFVKSKSFSSLSISIVLSTFNLHTLFVCQLLMLIKFKTFGRYCEKDYKPAYGDEKAQVDALILEPVPFESYCFECLNGHCKWLDVADES